MAAILESVRRGGGWLPWLFLPAVAFLAVLPLMVHGCSCGHDFDFHLVSWFEAAHQIAHGTLHPQWAFTPAWNAGEPRFVFYPPLSWYLGALLGMVLPWGAVPVVSTWVCLAGAGLACWFLLRGVAAPRLALGLAALYMVNPYLLFTAYERTAYGELLCAAWLPLLLDGILRVRVTVPRLAVPLCLLWLTNAPAAVLGTYSLALLAALRLVGSSDRLRLAMKTVAGTALGLALAAFYVIPAAYERRYIDHALAQAQSVLVTDNFLFEHTADAAHDAVLHTASLVATGLLLAALAALAGVWVRRRAEGGTALLLPLGGLTVAIAFLLTPWSKAIWLHAPDLAFLQFPWRFLAILTPALALMLALAFPPAREEDGGSTRKGPPGLVAAGAVVFLCVALSFHAFFQPCDEQDTVAARLALFRSPAGTEATDDYIPNTVDDEDTLGHTNPPFWLSRDPEAAPSAGVLAGPVPLSIDVNVSVPEVLILNLRDYPGWRLARNGVPLSTRLPRADGLLATPIPAGTAHLALAYVGGGDRTAGNVVSAVAIAALAYLLLRRRRRS